MLQKVIAQSILTIVFGLLKPSWAFALNNQNAQLLCAIPLESKFLVTEINPREFGVITANTPDQNEMTHPSLWWTKEQFDSFAGRLLVNWLAYPELEDRRIDLIIRREFWNIMDYIDRYRFVNEFGTVARQYGYNLRVFNQQNKCLAIYYYNTNSQFPKWEIEINP